MAVRGFVKSLVVRAVEPTVRSWMATAQQDNESALAAMRAELQASKPEAQPLTALQEEVAQLKKKLSMAMGAMQAASAQIVQLRQELEVAQNLAQQAMQKAVTAQTTAEAANEGVIALEENGVGTHLEADRPTQPSAQTGAGAPAPQGQHGQGGGKRNRQKKA